MTPERIKELRAAPLSSWSTMQECLDEIERLQARKPAPTREQVDAAIANRVGSWTGIYLVMFKDALEAAGLLATPEREPGWYWVRWDNIGDDRWEPCRLIGGRWNGVARQPSEIGHRIEGPPS